MGLFCFVSVSLPSLNLRHVVFWPILSFRKYLGSVSQSLYLGDIIQNFNDLNEGKENARWEIAKVCVSIFILALISKNAKNAFNLLTLMTSLRVRVCLSELIYRKVSRTFLNLFKRSFWWIHISSMLIILPTSGAEVKQEWLLKNLDRTGPLSSDGRHESDWQFLENASLPSGKFKSLKMHRCTTITCNELRNFRDETLGQFRFAGLRPGETLENAGPFLVLRAHLSGVRHSDSKLYR